MKEFYIGQFQNENEVVDYFMIKAVSLKIGSNKKQYLDVTLGDKTGEVSGKKWDVDDKEAETFAKLKAGDIVKIKAQVTEWNGMKQVRITRLRNSTSEDQIELRDYIKASPEDPKEMFEYIIDRIGQFEDDKLKALCTKLYIERKEKLLFYPAAAKNHHAELGGLLYHMKTMSIAGDKLCDVYKDLDRDLLITGVFLHDLEKLTEIESNELGIADGYSFEGQMLGHIIQGIKLLEKEMDALDFPYEKKIMIEHMILSHHYEPEFGSPRKPLFPEAEILHYLDIMDARMYDMFSALAKTEPGDFSDRIWVLENRKIYKPESGEVQND